MAEAFIFEKGKCMKKHVVVLIAMIAIILSGCSKTETVSNEEITKLESEIAQLEAERDRLNEEILNTKIDNGLAKYVITFNIKQTHFTLDIGEHLKDAMNDISIEIPVDKEYYDHVEVGDVIDDSFRMGSFIWKGSFGNWKVTVESKDIR